MLIDSTSLLENEHPLVSLATRRGVSPIVVGGHGGAVMLTSTKESRSLFPDEEHAYEPRRHVRFAALNRNALPNCASYCKKIPVSQRKIVPPPCSQQPSTPTSPAVQALRKITKTSISPRNNPNLAGRERVEYEEDPESRALWGFTVPFSPKKQLQAEWRAVEEKKQLKLQHQQVNQTRQLTSVTRRKQETKADNEDYAQYLYLANLYGPLDAVLYCCCRPGSHGRVYKLLVEKSARRLQRWAPQRIAALRKYWVGQLAIQVSENTLIEGLESVAYSFQQQRQATALLQRFKLLQTARALRSWRVYTGQMNRVQEKMRVALVSDIKSRFYLWRASIESRKDFKQQLKHVARRKAMQNRFDTWRTWRAQHEKLRCHFVKKWLEIKQKCWRSWCKFAVANRAVKTIQRLWRLYAWRKLRNESSELIARVYRGWKTRQQVMELRFKMDIHSVLIRVTNAAVWKCQCESLKAYRRRRFERTLNFAQEEAEWITQAEKEAATKVEIELNKVLRNSMHRKLEEHIAAIKEDASRSLKSSAELRKSATQRLIIEQRSCGRREAMASFRAIHAEQVQLRASCLICDAYLVCFTQEQLEKFNCPSEHKCLHNSGASEEASDASAEVKNWGNIAQGELSTLEKQEEEYLLRLLAKEPSVSSLWQAIVEKK